MTKLVLVFLHLSLSSCFPFPPPNLLFLAPSTPLASCPASAPEFRHLPPLLTSDPQVKSHHLFPHCPFREVPNGSCVESGSSWGIPDASPYLCDPEHSLCIPRPRSDLTLHHTHHIHPAALYRVKISHHQGHLSTPFSGRPQIASTEQKGSLPTQREYKRRNNVLFILPHSTG